MVKGIRCCCRLLAGLLLAAWLATGHAQVDPGVDWQSLESAHFRIHFAAEMETRARRALALAEQVHARLVPELEWTPARRTELVLTDQSDHANGFASPLPYNHIHLYATPPDSVAALEEFDDWMELLITHEYTHTLHLDRAGGLPAAARRVFGRNFLLFPNLFQPVWMIEGLAIDAETDAQQGVGRGQSALFAAWMRMELERGIKPFDQVSMSGITAWPMGNTPYLYGAYFFAFLEDRYGEEAVAALLDEYSDNLAPFLLNRSFRRVLGIDGSALWAEYERWLTERFWAQSDAIRARGLVVGERITRHGYRTASPRALPDGRVFYLRDDARSQPALMVLEGEASAPRQVAELRRDARFHVHPGAGVIVAQPEICRNYNRHYDLYSLNPDSGRLERLTRCSRYREAAWRPDGRALAARRIRAGRSGLDLLSPSGGLLRTLWDADDDTVLGAMDWSPDGDTLVASLWRPGKGWRLELLNVASGEWHALTEPGPVQVEPRFTPDGQGVLYSGAYGGVYNIQHLDPASGRITTLSNVPGAALSPSQALSGGEIHYIGYTPDGYDLFRLPAGAGPVTVVRSPETRAAQAPREPAPVATERQPHPYRPWPTLAPRGWMPLLAMTRGTTEVGAVVDGVDALHLHRYQAFASLEPGRRLAGGGIAYDYAGRIGLVARRVHDYSLDGGDLRRARSEDTLQGVVRFPVTRADWRFATLLGTGVTVERDQYRASGVAPAPDRTTGFAGLGFTFDNSRRHARSISRSDGRFLRLVAESNEIYGSDRSGEIYTLDWQEYLSLGGEHVLALRGVQGWATGQPRDFRLRSPSVGLMAAGAGPVFDRRTYPFRGYADTLSGRRLRLVSAEWRFPLTRVERAFVRVPLGLHQLSGRLFADSGGTWDRGGSPERMRTGLGGELHAELNAFYIINAHLRLGLARGIDQGGETQAYMTLGLPF